jgi:hypothetical protein
MNQPDTAPRDYSIYYREMADAIRALVPMLRFREARNELWLLANNYEWLADYLETHPALSEAARRALDVEWQARRGTSHAAGPS